jgi:hypothetical protein
MKYIPPMFVDPHYKSLISYIENTTGQKEEEFCHEEVDTESVRKLMEEQKKSNAYLRKIESKRLLSTCVIIDGFGERGDLLKAHGGVINSLLTRGSHPQISTFLLLQRFGMANPTIRYNAHCIYVHRLNSMKDREALAEEFGAVTGGTDVFLEIHKRSTYKKYGFLLITSGADPKFFSSYDSEFKINDNDSANEDEE